MLEALLKIIFVFVELKIETNTDPNSTEPVKVSCRWFFVEAPDSYDIERLKNRLIGAYDKDFFYFINFMHLYNFIKFFVYRNLKKIILQIYFFLIQIFLIVIFNNMPNDLVKNYLYFYYTLKKRLLITKKYIMLGYVKRWRWWRLYYRFYHISYLKVLYFFFFFILFILMWKRRKTYFKRIYFFNLVLFHVLSIIISFLLWPLFCNKCLSICVSLLISFFIIFIKLN